MAYPGITARRSLRLAAWLALGACAQAADPAATAGAATRASATAITASDRSALLECAGSVEVQERGATTWRVATAGVLLGWGDRVRTGPDSRAAVRLSDRSVLRLGERTILEIRAPQSSEKVRFELLKGWLFFFNRERPADVEFETPLATGAIRGTEFALSASEDDATTQLMLIDGKVELTAAGSVLALGRGEQALVERGRPPTKSPLLETRSILQWTLHYPAVLSPMDLGLSPVESEAFADSLHHYRSGDLLRAHEAAHGVAVPGVNADLYRAALDLSVGAVERADRRLNGLPATSAPARALRELVDVVRDPARFSVPDTTPSTASEWLARSYSLQAVFRLDAALEAATRATALDSDSGFARARRAELLLAFERRVEARAELDRALAAAPRLAHAQALRGFDFLDRYEATPARAAFDHALEIDAALGLAWLGRGLALLRLGETTEAVRSLQTAAALEPNRALYRATLAKAFGRSGDAALAAKELGLAKTLDPSDPTAWLYSALQAWEDNRPNTAVADLVRSVDHNHDRRLFRSRLALDRDASVRQANLAALYRDAGLAEAAQRSAAQAVAEDAANFSGHLFLANSYRILEDPNRFDLRYEAARQSELLLANLLAPPSSANLSQLVSPQEHLRYFEPPALAASTFTRYRSTGDWRQEASAFGATGGFAYAVDAAFDWQNGQELNDWRDRHDISAQFKQHVTESDDAYLQVAFMNAESGDVARHEDPAQAKANLRVSEEQAPNLNLGWHHAWSASSHSLLLYSRLTDRLTLHDDEPGILFLRRNAGTVSSVSTLPLVDLQYTGDFTLHSVEFQHLWQGEHHAVIAGARGQVGDVEPSARLSRPLSGVVSEQSLDESLVRFNAYTYHHWQLTDRLRWLAGVAYDRVEFPINSEIAPLTPGTDASDRVSPKVGMMWTPWTHGLFRAAYTQSLGGLYFDPSVRLEPTQLAGFTQAYRSLLPESVAGLVPGTRFETIGVGFDQILDTGTYFGLEAEWLESEGDRTVGALTNAGPLPIPDAPSATRQTLDYREGRVSGYVVQTIGEGLSLGARYRLSESRLEGRFPDIPSTAAGSARLTQDEKSVLQVGSLSLNYRHATGFFAQWESSWYHQTLSGFDPSRSAQDFWQHDTTLGYRWPRQRAELRLGMLNLFDTDYRLHPLGSYLTLPRQRTAVVSLRLNF